MRRNQLLREGDKIVDSRRKAFKFRYDSEIGYLSRRDFWAKPETPKSPSEQVVVCGAHRIQDNRALSDSVHSSCEAVKSSSTTKECRNSARVKGILNPCQNLLSACFMLTLQLASVVAFAKVSRCKQEVELLCKL